MSKQLVPCLPALQLEKSWYAGEVTRNGTDFIGLSDEPSAVKQPCGHGKDCVTKNHSKCLTCMV